MAIDYNGLSVVIPAVVAGVVGLGTFGMQVVNWLDQRKIKRSLEEARVTADIRDAKLDNLHAIVSGMADTQVAAAANV